MIFSSDSLPSVGAGCQPGCVKDMTYAQSTRAESGVNFQSPMLSASAFSVCWLHLPPKGSLLLSFCRFPRLLSGCRTPKQTPPLAPTRFYTPKVRRFRARCRPQETASTKVHNTYPNGVMHARICIIGLPNTTPSAYAGARITMGMKVGLGGRLTSNRGSLSRFTNAAGAVHPKDSGKVGEAPDRPPRPYDHNDTEGPKEWSRRRAGPIT
jgi:hypothetical protein